MAYLGVWIIKCIYKDLKSQENSQRKFSFYPDNQMQGYTATRKYGVSKNAPYTEIS